MYCIYVIIFSYVFLDFPLPPRELIFKSTGEKIKISESQNGNENHQNLSLRLLM